MHVVCEWIGNSQAVAAKHYLQVTDEHFLQASKEAVQNPVQQVARNSCATVRKKTQQPLDIPEDFQGLRLSVQAFKWAAQDSNLRLPPCEDGALTN